MTAILGLNSYHGDASACVVVDGVLRSAAEEERFRRVKHWAGFPSKAIESCIMEAGIGLSDIDHIAINSDPKANRLGKIAYTLSGRANPSLVLEKLITRGRRNNPIDELEKRFPDCTINANIHRVEHHLAHLGSCFLVSPYREAVCVSVDGFGDFSSAAWGFGREAIVEVDGKVGFPHSLGVFYQAMTQYLGFPRYGDEYKVMGLAAHGEPMYMDAMRDIVKTQADGTYRLDLSYFRHQRHEIGYEWADGAPDVSRLYSEKLEALVGPAREQDDPLTKRYKDLARSVQTMYEDALFHLLNHLYERYQVDTLTLSGGCAFNSVANGNVTSLTPFKRVYIQPAAGDAGGAIGAAYVAWHRLNGGARSFVMDHAYWGPAFS
ncbi:MAG: carbamoyltransferase, partial [Gammaproteobacteria bacterium]|nr:carbamoyltransferase [Gammaproteobacteria bacterium]